MPNPDPVDPAASLRQPKLTESDSQAVGHALSAM